MTDDEMMERVEKAAYHPSEAPYIGDDSVGDQRMVIVDGRLNKEQTEILLEWFNSE